MGFESINSTTNQLQQTFVVSTQLTCSNGTNALSTFSYPSATPLNGQPVPTATQSYFNEKQINGGGVEFTLPPITSIRMEDVGGSSGGSGSGLDNSTNKNTINTSGGDGSSGGSSITQKHSSEMQTGTSQRLPSIKLLDLEQTLPHHQQTSFSSFVPINLEGNQNAQSSHPMNYSLNSPSSLNLNLWSLNSPSNIGGGFNPTTTSVGYSSQQQHGQSSIFESNSMILRGPSHLPNTHSYQFQPINHPILNNNNSTLPQLIPYQQSSIPDYVSNKIDEYNNGKRKSIDSLESVNRNSSGYYGVDSKNGSALNKVKRYSFSTYSPPIQSKKLYEPKRNSASNDDLISPTIQRRSSFKEIPIESIVQHLHLPQKDAAKNLGVSVSTLKRRFYSVREQIGIDKWPTLSTATISQSQQSLTSVLVKYPVVNSNSDGQPFEYHLINPPSSSSSSQNSMLKEEESTSTSNSTPGISSASCAPVQAPPQL